MSLIMEQFMRASGLKMVIERGEEFNSGNKELFMKGTGKMIRQVDKADLSSVKVIVTVENGTMTWHMEMARMITLMVAGILVAGKKISFKDMA